jgi:hypothetical protein
MTERPMRAARTGVRGASIRFLVGFFAGALVGPAVARAALAAERPYVTIYGAPADPVVLHLVPELMAFGCVVRVDASPVPEPATFMAGDAVVRVTTAAVTYWLVDPRTGRAFDEGTVDIQDRGPEGIELTSLRVSEIVRAQLLHVEPSAPSSRAAMDTAPPAADAGAPAATREASTDATGATRETTSDEAGPSNHHPEAVPNPTHLSVGLGPLLVLAPGGTKPAFDLALSPGWHPSRSLQVRALFAAPLTSPRIVATGGEAAVSTWLGGAAIDWQPGSGDDTWRGTLGGGAAAVLSHAHGAATAPYVASTTTAVSALPFVEVGGSRSLGTPRVRLGVSGMLGFALPEIAIQFAARRVATWGLPVVGAVSAALDVAIW